MYNELESTVDELGSDWQICGYRRMMRYQEGFLLYEHKPSRLEGYRLQVEIANSKEKGNFIRIFEEYDGPFGIQSTNLFRGWVKEISEVPQIIERYELTKNL